MPLYSSTRLLSQRVYLTIVLVVVLVGALLSFRIYRNSNETARLAIQSDFDRRAEAQNALMGENFFYYESGVYALKSLFDGSSQVTREDFRRVASDILIRYPGLTALEWVPAVANADRARFEAEATNQLGKPFRFTEVGSDGSMTSASDRPEHYPIYYLEPIAGNERALGYDIQSSATVSYLAEARRTRRLVVRNQMESVQRPRAFVIVWPVYAPHASDAETPEFRGFVQAILGVEEMCRTTQLRRAAPDMEMLCIDDRATLPSQRILYYQSKEARDGLSSPPSEAEFRNGFHREYVIEFGGRHWVVLYRPTSEWMDAQYSGRAGLRLSVGLLMTALLAGFIAVQGRRASAVQQEVAVRTAELSESRRHLSSLLYALPGMAYRCSYRDKLAAIYLSEGVFALTGYRPEAFMAEQPHFRDVIHPEDLARVRAATRAGLKNRQDVEVEYRIRPRSGPEKWILSRGRGVYDEQGELLFLEGLAIDITARKQAEAEKLTMERKLLESQKLESLGLLAGGIAHDFNNLLTSIMGHANLARFHPTVDQEVTDHLHKIEAGVLRAAELCQQMLAYSGRSNFLVEPIDLNQLVRETVPLLQCSLSSRARLHLQLSGEPMVVMADATQLRQIVMNLILNASDAVGDRGGEIFVSSGQRHVGGDFLTEAHVADSIAPGEHIFLEVRDTGCGMTSETLTKIFDPFFTTKFTGRGLGLAAVLGIVRGHSGALRVQSQPNQGSTFTLILPRSTASISRNGDVASDESWQRSGKVLVIDDEESVRNVAAALLRTFGLTVTVASSGLEGIQRYREGSFDLVLLDLTMPELDGEATLKQLREIAPNVRVLLVSGYSENDRIAELAAGGPLLFLQKPFTRASLEGKLQEILSDCPNSNSDRV